MTVFLYDNTFEGLLSCVFAAYARRTFPDRLLPEGEPLPLFCGEAVHVATDARKADRVWRGLGKKLSGAALFRLAACRLAEWPETDGLLFRYIRKAIDAPASIETNFADPDVLDLFRIYKKVEGERMRLIQFIRFQKAADGTFFAAVEPLHNALPLTVDHFTDRFADQRWLIYDIKRQYGYYYDLHEAKEVAFDDPEQAHLVTGMLGESLADRNEALFQQLWKTYFKAICIRERWNPQKHRKDLPVRYWTHLTE